MFKYDDLLKEVELFCKNGIQTGVVGESQLGRRIPYIFVGKKNGHYMIVQAAIHAREHLTSLLVINQAKYLVKHPQLTMMGGIFFVPMTNPDGVCLCQSGLTSITDKQQQDYLLKTNGSNDFSLWKANINGVDLNTNFDANWGKGIKNVFAPSSENFVGDYPFSEKETCALAKFTKNIKPCVTLSYHLKGEEIYWEFGQTSHRQFRDRRLAEAIAKYTGYAVKTTHGSVGGYKDWCIEKFHIPSFTIEVGNDKYSHPFPYEQFNKIYAQNQDLPRRLLNTVVKDNEALQKAGLLNVYK